MYKKWTSIQFLHIFAKIRHKILTRMRDASCRREIKSWIVVEEEEEE